jgi:hypothetical protein
MDAAVAERVFGMERREHKNIRGGAMVSYIAPSGVWYRFSGIAPSDQIEPPVRLCHYSTDIGAAWALVEALKDRIYTNPDFDGTYKHGKYLQLEYSGWADNPWKATMPGPIPSDGGGFYIACCATAPEAICRAALKAAGVSDA